MPDFTPRAVLAVEFDTLLLKRALRRSFSFILELFKAKNIKRNRMSLPNHQELMLPLLKLLNTQGQAIQISQVGKLLAEQSNLTTDELNQMIPSGKRTVFYDRVGWAKTYLVKAGLVNQPDWGMCELSEEAKKLDLNVLDKIDNNFLMRYESFREFKVPTKIRQNKEKIICIEENDDIETPEESLQRINEILLTNLKDDLLNLIQTKNPYFFERLVVDLLVAMGYGGSHQDAAQAIGKTSDGGIDGIISEDRLGLDKIYIQAKRWKNTVGRPDIQQFKGALADQVAKKGVFITTSNFSKEAVESAKKSGIVLIDGDKLTSLMIEFGLGVQVERSFNIYKIDQDRFDEDNF